MPDYTSTQNLLTVRLRKFGREVLHKYQAGMSVTSGRVSTETLDAYYKAFPIMDTVEFRDINPGTVVPTSVYSNVTINDRILMTEWKSLQNIKRIDQDIESHIAFDSEYQKAVAMAAARKKDQTVFAHMIGAAIQVGGSSVQDRTKTGNTGFVTRGAMTPMLQQLSRATGSANFYGFDSAASGGIDIYEALTRIKRDLRKRHVGYGEKVYVTLTPDLEYLLRNNEKFINTDYNDRKPSAGDVSPTEFAWNGFNFIETDPSLLPSNGNFDSALKFSLTKGFGKINTGAGGAAIAGSSAIIWTSRAVKAGTHSMGFKSIVYREPTRVNSPAIQHDFFCGAVRLLDEGVYVLRFK